MRILLAGATGVIGRQAVPSSPGPVTRSSAWPTARPGSPAPTWSSPTPLTQPPSPGAVRITAQGITYAYDPAAPRSRTRTRHCGAIRRAGSPPVLAALLAAVDHPAASGVLNIVDDQPTLARDWLPEMAAWRGAPAPGHIPAWLAGCSPAGGPWPS
jgi:hypothetical protein